MTDADPRAAAIDALYCAPPDQFVRLRTALAAEATAAGEPAVAAEIAQLRRPTRSAWIVNCLVRNDRAVVERLTGLGDELRAAHRHLDGAAIRELTRTRRDAVTRAVQAAVAASGIGSVSDSIRAEVLSTVDAVVADRAIADQVLGGRLVRPLAWAGFGAAGPELSVVTPAERPAEPSAPGVKRSVGADGQPAAAEDPHPHRTIAQAELESARAALVAAEELHAAAQAEVAAREKALAEAKAAVAEAGDGLRRARIHERNAAARAARRR